MNQGSANINPDQRRGIRRTVWITGAIALAMFVMFFVVQFNSH
jgi:hypothetical protein